MHNTSPGDAMTLRYGVWNVFPGADLIGAPHVGAIYAQQAASVFPKEPGTPHAWRGNILKARINT